MHQAANYCLRNNSNPSAERWQKFPCTLFSWYELILEGNNSLFIWSVGRLSRGCRLCRGRICRILLYKFTIRISPVILILNSKTANNKYCINQHKSYLLQNKSYCRQFKVFIIKKKYTIKQSVIFFTHKNMVNVLKNFHLE